MDKNRLQCLRNIAIAKNAGTYQRDHSSMSNESASITNDKEEDVTNEMEDIQIAKLKISAWSPGMRTKCSQKTAVMPIIHKDVHNSGDPTAGIIFTTNDTEKLANALTRRKANLRRTRKTRNRKSSCCTTSQSDHHTSSGNDTDNELSSDSERTNRSASETRRNSHHHHHTASGAILPKPFNHNSRHQSHNDDDSDSDSCSDPVTTKPNQHQTSESSLQEPVVKKVLSRTSSDQSWVVSKNKDPLMRSRSEKYKSKVSRVIPCDGVNFTLTMGKFALS